MVESHSVSQPFTSSNQMCYIENIGGGTFISYKGYRTSFNTFFEN